jgi:hypothetical protein
VASPIELSERADSDHQTLAKKMKMRKDEAWEAGTGHRHIHAGTKA